MDITIKVIYARLQNIQANHSTDYGVLVARPRGIQVMHEYYDLSLSKIGIKDKYLPQRKAQRTRYLTLEAMLLSYIIYSSWEHIQKVPPR